MNFFKNLLGITPKPTQEENPQKNKRETINGPEDLSRHLIAQTERLFFAIKQKNYQSFTVIKDNILRILEGFYHFESQIKEEINLIRVVKQDISRISSLDEEAIFDIKTNLLELADELAQKFNQKKVSLAPNTESIVLSSKQKQDQQENISKISSIHQANQELNRIAKQNNELSIPIVDEVITYLSNLKNTINNDASLRENKKYIESHIGSIIGDLNKYKTTRDDNDRESAFYRAKDDLVGLQNYFK